MILIWSYPIASYAFQTTGTLLESRREIKSKRCIHHPKTPPPSLITHLSSHRTEKSFMDRFTNPILDDPYLPISDVCTAQIVAPSLQVFWISLAHGPSPTWLRPVFDSSGVLWQTRGSLMAPTLIHGAGLACCWLLGALAAKAYESKAIYPTVEEGGYVTVITTILKAGAFATGVLILATQVDLLFEFGRLVQPGESDEADLRILSAWVEVLNDIVFEATTLTFFRLFLAVSSSQGRNP